jgi:molecular chaperone HscB
MSSSSNNHFDLFELPVRFSLDRAALDKAYRTIQAQVHPDRFANSDEAQKRVAMQWATRANEAHQTLRDPLKRALYLLELRGIDARAEHDTSIAPDFLMQQIEWREAIDDAAAARNVGALDAVLAELREATRIRFDKLEGWLDSGADQPAAETARELLFIERVAEAARKQVERIEDA